MGCLKSCGERLEHVTNFMLLAREQLLLCRLAWDVKAFAGVEGRGHKGLVLEEIPINYAECMVFCFL